MDAFELNAIKSKWEKEVDYCLIVAANQNFEEYPAEVQKVIRTEFEKRGLKKQNGIWLSRQATKGRCYPSEIGYHGHTRYQLFGKKSDIINCF